MLWGGRISSNSQTCNKSGSKRYKNSFVPTAVSLLNTGEGIGIRTGLFVYFRCYLFYILLLLVH